jgi:hypothetical protein
VTDNQLQEIERQLEIIKQRNARVEADKAWEASRVRVGAICVITYLVTSAFLYVMGAQRFWLHALVPPCGFFLSTRSLRLIKRWWIESRYQATKSQ